MCRKQARAVLAVGVCLATGIVLENACSWSPPPRVSERADSVVVETIACAAVEMWPGEMRRVRLPGFERAAGERCRFDLSAGAKVTLSVDTLAGRLVRAVRGVLPPRAMAELPWECIFNVDTLAVPGDTLSVVCTVTRPSKPARALRFHMPVVVTTLPSVSAPALTASVSPLPAKQAPRPLSAQPNPFALGTTISFFVAGVALVTVEIFDCRGRCVTKLLNNGVCSGAQELSWDGGGAQSGVYIVCVRRGVVVSTMKVVRVK